MPALPDVPYIVLAPNGHETMGYASVAEEDVHLVPAMFRISFRAQDGNIVDPIDENRLYLTGLSMGGGGTGRLGIQYPELFAAIAPVCGYFNANFRGSAEGMPEFIKHLIALKSPKNMAENLLHVPVKLMHGDADTVVPPDESREMHKILKDLDYHTELEIYPGVGHDAWTNAYEDARIFDWFSQFERDPYPKHIRFKTAETPHGSYWLSIRMAKKLREFASVDAKIEDGVLRIQTNNVEKFLVKFHDKLVPMDKELKVIVDEDHEFVMTPNDYRMDIPGLDSQAMVFISQNGDQWNHKKWDALQDENTGYPYPKLSGIMAPVESRHVYTYGTTGSSDEVNQNKSLANEKAFWGDMTDVRWLVVPEDELDYTIYKEGVILFSKVNASTFIQEHMAKLPISIKGEKIHFGDRVVEKDQAFIFVHPSHEHAKYITICTATTNEGMKALEKFAKERYSFLGNTYGDFVCLDKDGNPVWGGLFDKDWKIETIEEY
jgi:dienelactone hydrolase